jgi:hypothetical protein
VLERLDLDLARLHHRRHHALRSLPVRILLNGYWDPPFKPTNVRPSSNQRNVVMPLTLCSFGRRL